MRALFTAALLAMLALGAASGPAFADDKAKEGKDKKAAPAKAEAKGEVSLKGQMMCAKCALKDADKCQNVLKVSDGGKETAYYLVQNDVAKKAHGKVCGGAAGATVKGTVGEDGGKKTLTASEIKYE
jgi:hypothetical protein